MIPYIKFCLKRKITDKLFILINIIVFIALYIFFHIDYLISNNSINNVIGLDESVKQYYDLFENLNSDNKYIYSSDCDITIHYEDGFIINFKNNGNEEIIKNIENDIKEVVKKDYLSKHKFLNEYVEKMEQIQKSEIIKKDTRDISTTLILSVIYFIISSYGSLISNDVIYEKGSNVLESLLTNISTKEFLLSKIIIAYVTPIIQIVIGIIELIIVVIFRYNNDKFNGFIVLLGNYINTENIGSEINISVFSIGLIILIIFTGLLVIQLIMLLLTSSLKNNQQAINLINTTNIILLILYCLWIFVGDDTYIKSYFIKSLSFVPIISTIFMPLRIVIKSATIIEALIIIPINIISIIMIIKYCLPYYQKSILNYDTKV